MGLKRLTKRLPGRADGVPRHRAASYAWRYRWARMLGRGRPQGRGPIVVGALGGSATRLVVDLLRRSGVWMGDWVDRESDDSLAFRVFLRRHFSELAAASVESGTSLDTARASAIHQSFERSVLAHTLSYPGGDTTWGWKNPRMLWLLPFLASEFPRGLHFIHVLRDGREMALSENRFLLEREGPEFLDTPLPEDPVLAQLRLWARGNREAARAAAQHLGEDRYLRLRYEDLCQRPVETITELLGFVGVFKSAQQAEMLAAGVVPSGRVGRWRDISDDRLTRLDAETRAALAEFGYL